MTDIKDMVMVFGSNLAGIHGAGAAAYALKHKGAVWGEGIGHHGNSYAIPTKDRKIRSMTTTPISMFVRQFLEYATAHPELEFQVTQVGCGLAGMTPSVMAPMFKGAPKNCQFDTAWSPWLGADHHYWGHVP